MRTVHKLAAGQKVIGGGRLFQPHLFNTITPITPNALTTFYVTQQADSQKFFEVSFKGESDSVTVDYTGWSVDGGDITAITWEVTDGHATIDREVLKDNRTTALIRTARLGSSILRVTATAGNNITVNYIRVTAMHVSKFS